MIEREGPANFEEAETEFAASKAEAGKIDSTAEGANLEVVEGGMEGNEVVNTSVEQIAAELGFTENQAMLQIRNDLAELALRSELNDDILLEKYTAYQDAGSANVVDGADTRSNIGKLVLEAGLLATYGHADLALEQIEEIVAISWGDEVPEDSVSGPLLKQAAELIRQKFSL